MGPQLVHSEATRRHSQTPRINGPGALNVQWGVSNHHDFLPRQFLPHVPHSPQTRRLGNLVSRLMIVGKPSQFEFVPQRVGAQFDLGTQTDIPSQ